MESVMKKHTPIHITTKKTKKKTPEKEIQSEICKYLKAQGIFFWRNNTGVAMYGNRRIRYGAIGSPDILAIVKNGVLLGIEVKTQAGRQNEAQKRFQESMEKAGADYILARSVEDVKKYFQTP